jgi:hypothetical protein
LGICPKNEKMPKKVLTKTRLEIIYIVKLTGWINHMVDKKQKKG